jgi:hypothetical protein
MGCQLTDSAIDFYAYPASVKEAWGFFEALRRLGFPSEVLFFSDRIVAPNGTVQLGVVLQWNGKTAAFYAGEPCADWAQMIETFNHAPEPVLQRIWDESFALKHSVDVILVLRGKGIELPP